MSLKHQITEDMKTAMRAKDAERLGTIRLLLAAMKQKEVDERVELDDVAVVAIVDTNCSPDGVDYIIPGNDDAARAIALYCDLVSRAALDGMSAQMGAAGVDLGSLSDAPEELLDEAEAPAEA